MVIPDPEETTTIWSKRLWWLVHQVVWFAIVVALVIAVRYLVYLTEARWPSMAEFLELEDVVFPFTVILLLFLFFVGAEESWPKAPSEERSQYQAFGEIDDDGDYGDDDGDYDDDLAPKA